VQGACRGWLESVVSGDALFRLVLAGKGPTYHKLLMNTPQKILVRTPNWLGDLMMATAFLRALLKQFPDAQVDLLVKKGFESIPLPHRGEVLVFDSSLGVKAMAKQLKGRYYSHGYLLTPSYSSALMFFLGGIKTRVGLKGQFGRSMLLNQVPKQVIEERGQHISKEYQLLLDPTGNTEPGLPGLALPKGWSDGLLHGGLNLKPGFVAIAPGAVYGPAKRWPYEHYLGLIHRLHVAGERVVILGQEGDFPLETTEAENLTGQTSLLELIALLSRSKVLVSNDSGAMHIMAALRKPQVAVFGSTSTLWTSPTNPKARVVSLHLDCAPCFKRVCPYGHYKCLHQIDPELVFDAYLDATGQPAELADS